MLSANSLNNHRVCVRLLSGAVDFRGKLLYFFMRYLSMCTALYLLDNESMCDYDLDVARTLFKDRISSFLLASDQKSDSDECERLVFPHVHL